MSYFHLIAFGILSLYHYGSKGRNTKTAKLQHFLVLGLNTSLLINSHIAIMTINKSKDQRIRKQRIRKQASRKLI